MQVRQEQAIQGNIAPERPYGRVGAKVTGYEQRFILHVPGGRGRLFPKVTKITDCPSVFSLSGYEPYASRFLRETFSGRWRSPFAGSSDGHSKAITSIIGTGDALVNFLSWSALANAPLAEITYNDVLQYQDDMISGAWSLRGRRIGPGTINSRGAVACSFLMFLHDIGYRSPFVVPSFVKQVKSSKTGQTHDVTMRVGTQTRKRTSVDRLGLPKEAWKDDWLEAVRSRRGTAKMLACRSIIQFGPRISEVCGMEVHQWPTADAISAAKRAGDNTIRMSLMYTKRDVPRDVEIETNYARLVRNWIDSARGALISKYTRRTGEPAHTILFVSDAVGHEGTPLSKSRLYECFKIRPSGYEGRWYPHKGRHYLPVITCALGWRRLRLSTADHCARCRRNGSRIRSNFTGIWPPKHWGMPIRQPQKFMRVSSFPRIRVLTTGMVGTLKWTGRRRYELEKYWRDVSRLDSSCEWGAAPSRGFLRVLRGPNV